MKQLKVFLAILALSCMAFFPAVARADGSLDDLDVTMEVLDDKIDLSIKLSEMRGPDFSGVEHEDDAEDQGSDHGSDDEQDQEHDERREHDEADEFEDEEHDDGFDHDDELYEDEFEDEDDFETGDEVDTDEFDDADHDTGHSEDGDGAG